MKRPAKRNKAGVKCRICGCTDDNCSLCIQLTGEPCSWVAPDLCSACLGIASLEAQIGRSISGTRSEWQHRMAKIFSMLNIDVGGK